MSNQQRPSYREGNSTADRTLSILQMFTESRRRVTAAEVATHLGVSRSTAYRYLQPLVGSDFIADDGDSRFSLGPKVMELSVIARRGYGLAERATPVMKRLAERFHETVLLTRRVGSAIVCIDREEWAGRHLRLSYERGSQLSFNAGASAFALLAWLDEEEVRQHLRTQPLPRYTDATLTTIDAIVDRLQEIREAGYAIARGEVDQNVIGLAAPIFDHEERVVAALSIVLLPTEKDNDLEPMIQALVSAAEQLSNEQRLRGL